MQPRWRRIETVSGTMKDPQRGKKTAKRPWKKYFRCSEKRSKSKRERKMPADKEVQKKSFGPEMARGRGPRIYTKCFTIYWEK